MRFAPNIKHSKVIEGIGIKNNKLGNYYSEDSYYKFLLYSCSAFQIVINNLEH